MRFQYSLQKIVDLKCNERTQAEWKLADALTELRTEEQTLRQLQNNKEFIAQSLNEASAQCAKIADLLVYQQYIHFMEKQIEKKGDDVKLAQHQVVQQKHVLTERMIDEKRWDKAREKAYIAHLAHSLKKEQEATDELVTLRYTTTEP